METIHSRVNIGVILGFLMDWWLQEIMCPWLRVPSTTYFRGVHRGPFLWKLRYLGRRHVLVERSDLELPHAPKTQTLETPHALSVFSNYPH